MRGARGLDAAQRRFFREVAALVAAWLARKKVPARRCNAERARQIADSK